MGLSTFHTSTIIQVVFALAGAGAASVSGRFQMRGMDRTQTRMALQSIIVFIVGAGLTLTIGLPTARYAMGSQPGVFAHVMAAGFSGAMAFVFGYITSEIGHKIPGKKEY